MNEANTPSKTEGQGDCSRMDWLEKLANVKIWEQQNGRWHVHIDRDERTRMPITGDTLRAAIDAAMKAAGAAGERVDVCEQSGAGSQNDEMRDAKGGIKL